MVGGRVETARYHGFSVKMPTMLCVQITETLAGIPCFKSLH